jgi:FemAB family protein
MDIVQGTDDSFWSLWRKLNDYSVYDPPYYSEDKYLIYKKIIGDNLVNESFLIVKNKIPLLGILMSIEGKNGCYVISGFGRGIYYVENQKYPLLITKSLKKCCIDYFNNKIIEYDIEIVLLRDHIINNQLSFLSKEFLSNGATVKTHFTQVLDLNRDDVLRKSSIRKSYKSLINWGLRELQPKIYDSENISWELMDDFRQLHINEAGRETRSVDSWRQQFDMVKKGEAFVIFGSYEDKLVSAGLFMHTKTNCYYGVSASRRDLFGKPMFHSLMWTAIQNAKKLGCHWFEMGEHLYPSDHNDKPFTKKEVNISKFKTGFGGEPRVFLDLELKC